MNFNICKSAIGDDKLTIQSDRMILRPTTLADCTPAYVSWLQDTAVNQFLETRWHSQNMSTIREFVEKTTASEDSFLFTIKVKPALAHIGNIKLGPVNRYHGYADVSYFIGEKSYWGTGLATEAIRLVTQFGFEVLQLYRLQAGVYQQNGGSARALEKAGYQLEGCFRQQLSYSGGRDNHLWFGITVDDWRMQQ